MSLCVSRGVGVYVASEAHTCAWQRLYKPDATRRPLIFFPGGVGGDRKFLDDAGTGKQLAPALVESDIPIISAAFGGPSLWGNSTTVTRIGEAWAQIKTQLNTKTDQFVGIGVSQGATALLNYTKANPEDVAALVLIVPAVDVDDIHSNDRNGLAAAIEAAHGGPPAEADNPAANTDDFDLPMKLYYASDDDTVIASTVTDFASATGAETVNLGAVGHTAETVNPASVGNFFNSNV